MRIERTLLLLLALMVCLPMAAIDKLKINHGPYLQNLGETEVTLVWTTDKPSVGWVEVAPDDGSHFYATARPKFFDTNIGIKNTSTLHTVKLTGLKPGTRYRYRACSQEVLEHEGNRVVYGAVDYTDVYGREPLSFVTLDAGKSSIEFAMVNDIHERNEVLEKMVNQCDLKSTDLFLFNGDMVSFFNSEEQVFAGFMDTATKLFASSVPMYYCRGNHETRGQFAPEFHKYFNQGSGELYYMFRQGPVCFVVLDCGEDKPDTDVEYYGITDYDGYRTQQAQWLKKAVESDLYKNAPYKVVVCHMPPFGGWHGEIDVANKFVPILNAAKPDVYLCGHLHKYFRYKAGENGCDFPLIVNSNNTLLKASAGNGKLSIRIYDLDGKETDRLDINK